MRRPPTLLLRSLQRSRIDHRAQRPGECVLFVGGSTKRVCPFRGFDQVRENPAAARDAEETPLTSREESEKTIPRDRDYSFFANLSRPALGRMNAECSDSSLIFQHSLRSARLFDC